MAPTCTSSLGQRSDEGSVSLVANHYQGHARGGAQRVERRAVACAQAQAGRCSIGSRADVARGGAARVTALLERGVRCRRGELHGPYTYLAVYLAGHSRMVYVPKALAELATEHVELTQRNEALLSEISQVNLELLRRRALE